VAKVLGFRYDANREAYVLRLVGNRFGPVIRSGAVDSAARMIGWSGDMDELAARRRTGRFTPEPEDAPAPTRDVLNR
jgi:hypothetical protein